jgi:ATP-dependent DNA helicase DinG
VTPVERFFAPDGPLAKAWPGFEPREGQREMAVAVEGTLEHGGSLIVEAGTGIGKTLAYLVPAILAGRKVIISTGTRNLQDQIARKDLPALEEILGRSISYAIMKGRENYLCLSRFRPFDQAPLLEIREEAEHLDTLREWADTTESGDRGEVDSFPDRLRFWRDINARADTCTGSRCADYEGCYLTKMRRHAESAQIVIVNHHLFFADLAVRSAYGSVIPEYDTVVFDEAHLLEETATMYFGVRVGKAQIEELARKAEKFAGKGKRARGMGGAAPLRDAAKALFGPIARKLPPGPGRSPLRSAAAGGPDLEIEWATLCARLDAVREELKNAKADESEIEAFVQQIETVREGFTRALARDDPEFVYSVEIREGGGWTLSAAPIEIGNLLKELLYPRLESVVWTSATLSVGGGFDYFRGRLALQDESITAQTVASPFEPQEQALLYLPKRMPEPREPAFLDRAVEEIRELLEISDGRAFLLFTSHAMLGRVRDAIEDDCPWPLFVQGDGGRAGLLERFVKTPRAVLLGTTSFWHGVDVKGSALSMVIVDKLPFAVPNDPLVSARIDRIREEGGNPFGSYQTPMAVLELKQGFGRLLRSRDDRGVVCILDPRIVGKGYGKVFLRSLPPFRQTRDLTEVRSFFENLSDAPAAVSMVDTDEGHRC